MTLWLDLVLVALLLANVGLLARNVALGRRARARLDQVITLDMLLSRLVHDSWIGAASRAPWWAWAHSMGDIRIQIVRHGSIEQMEDDDG